MHGDYLLYLAEAGDVEFGRSSQPCVLVGLLVPNRAQSELAKRTIVAKADAKLLPYTSIDSVTVRRALGQDAAPPDVVTSAPGTWPVHAGSNPDVRALLNDLLGVLAVIEGIRCLACVAKPNAMIGFRRVRSMPSHAEQAAAIWLESTHMVLQKAHIFLNDEDAHASVITRDDRPITTAAKIAFITAPGYDPHITFRRYADTLVHREAEWSHGSQYAQLIADILGEFLRDGSMVGLELLTTIRQQFLGVPDRKTLGRGVTELPRGRAKLKSITRLCEHLEEAVPTQSE